MDSELQRLAEKIVALVHKLPSNRRVLVCIAGPPGSGKSTLAYPLTDRINTYLGQSNSHSSFADQEEINLGKPSGLKLVGGGNDVAICVSLDGWHFRREELDRFDDPEQAHFRRGAPFTFNVIGYSKFIQSLKNPITQTPIPFSTFDHALKDPLPSPTPIQPRHRVIIIEGLYCLFDKPIWRDTAMSMDVRIWLDVDRKVARRRLIRRNLEAGVGKDLNETIRRADESDMVNGDEIRNHLVEPTDIVQSIDDPALRPDDMNDGFISWSEV